MASLDKIKQRMKSINTTSKIIKAMELVATAKIKKERKRFDKIKLYFDDIMANVSEIIDGQKSSSPFLVKESGSCLWIVLGSDLGLCGGYNINNIKHLNKDFKKGDLIISIGQKAHILAKSYKLEILEAYNQIINDFSFEQAQGITQKAISIFIETKKITKIKLVASKFINNASFKAEIINLLPLETKTNNSSSKRFKAKEFEPSFERVLNTYVPLFMSFIIYNKVCEAKLVEQSSRRLAMESASKNAKEILSDLKIRFNRQRQANITQEISEIIAGANS